MCITSITHLRLHTRPLRALLRMVQEHVQAFIELIVIARQVNEAAQVAFAPSVDLLARLGPVLNVVYAQDLQHLSLLARYAVILHGAGEPHGRGTRQHLQAP